MFGPTRGEWPHDILDRLAGRAASLRQAANSTRQCRLAARARRASAVTRVMWRVAANAT
jgi:hypothetical protein